MSKIVRDVRTIVLTDKVFEALITITNSASFQVRVRRRYSPVGFIHIYSEKGLDNLRDLLDEIHDTLANENLAGEIIMSMK